MIVVIADDLTGATELAGIALRCNLSVEVVMNLSCQSQPDVLIVATDTRSKKEAEAVEEIRRITRKVINLRPAFVFKKIDSVLRGHVLAEVKAQLEIAGLKSALIVSANPTLDRTIVDGHYYYKDQPIHVSSFSSDPEFPIASSYVPHMLRADGDAVHIKKPYDDLPEEGVFVGAVSTTSDLKAWAEKNLENILPVGAAGFFNALLERRGYRQMIHKENDVPVFRQPNLFVCGTSFQKSRTAIKGLKDNGGPVAYMPTGLLRAENKKELQSWYDKVKLLLQQYGTAVMAIDAENIQEFPVDAIHLRQQMALAVQNILQEKPVSNLFIEGGSTASAILKQTGIERLIPTNDIAPGVTRLYAPQHHLHITLKPGSYDWPEHVWALTSNKQFAPYEQSRFASH